MPALQPHPKQERIINMKIINIVGARPQFIKYFPISNAIVRFNIQTDARINDVLVHTGQHYDYNMSKIFFDGFSMKVPDYYLCVGSGTHGRQTAEILKKTEEVLFEERPDVVIVYGDTNSTLGGMLAAVKLHIPVAHVEAGLRSFNKYMPEEINRILTDHISTYLFCSSENAVKQLKIEGITNGINTGDVMYDVLLNAKEIAEKKSDIIDSLGLREKEYGVLTIHRPENTDNIEKFKEIISFVNSVANDKEIIFPMHPRSMNIYNDYFIKHTFADNIKIIDPVSYFDSIMLLKNSKLLLTDSGGMQKEAYWLKVPCITLREETEWTETVESGWNILYKDYSGSHKINGSQGLLYGDGHAADKIINILETGFINE